MKPTPARRKAAHAPVPVMLALFAVALSSTAATRPVLDAAAQAPTTGARAVAARRPPLPTPSPPKRVGDGTPTDPALQRLFYIDAAGDTRLHDAYALSDGSVLLAGEAANLDWVPAGVPRIALGLAGIASASPGRVAFLAQVSQDLGTLKAVAAFPAGSVHGVTRIRGTEVPGAHTGALFISGQRDNVANDGYYIARLDGNFVDALPTGLVWGRNIDTRGSSGTATDSNSHKVLQPWDVGSDGRVVFAEGKAFAPDWVAIHRLDPSGQREVVEHWRDHWTPQGTEWRGTPASSAPVALAYSGLVMKSGRIGQLRSADALEYAQVSDDENGNPGRKGRWPDDYYYAQQCAYAGCDNKSPGYTGYRTGSNPTERVGAIVIDRRSNAFYIGYSTQSRLPDGNPDFEPAVIAMDAQGALRWWARLYRETTANSSPDQYVDGLAIDYAADRLVVLARSHGNNTVNFWSGNALQQSPGASGYQNRFSGTNGNIHVSWLGKYGLADGRIHHATWVAEFNEDAVGGGASADPLMGGWPDPNAGWPNLNTTRCRNALSVYADGSVLVACTGRRTATTLNALQQMPLPGRQKGTWNEFVRVYTPDLSRLRYSSLLTGDWNRTDGSGGDNTTIDGALAVADGLVAVGYHRKDAATGLALGQPVPALAVPEWGRTTPVGESALLARLRFDTGLAPASAAGRRRVRP